MLLSRKFGISAFAFTCLAVSLGALPTRAGEIPADRRLPPQVFLYLNCPDAPKAAEQIKESSLGRLINDPAMEEFRGHVLQRSLDLQTEIEGRIGVLLTDLMGMFQGEVTFAVARPIGQPLGLVVFVEFGEQRETLDKLLAKLDETLTERGSEKSQESLEGAEAVVHTFPVQGPRTGVPNSLAYFIKDGVFVAGSSTGILEDVLSRWAGTNENCLAGAKAYAAVREQCRTNPRSQPTFTYFLDPVGLTSAGLAMSPETQMAGILFSGYLPTVGLNKLKGIGGTMEFATADFDVIGHTLLYCEQPASGLLNVFDFRPTVTGPPAWVPADVSNFIAFDWNVGGAYTAVESLVDSMAGGPGTFARLVDQNTIFADGTRLHPKRDVIDALDGTLQGFMTTPTENNPGDIGVLMLGVGDPEKAKKLVETFAKTGRFSQAGDFQGEPIYTAENGPGALCLRGDQLFIASGDEQLKQALTSMPAEGSLADSPVYASLKPHLPEKMSMLVLSVVTEGMAESYEKARGGAYDGLLQGRVDLSKLPPFEKVKPYLLPAASYVVPTEQGALSVRFAPKVAE